MFEEALEEDFQNLDKFARKLPQKVKEYTFVKLIGKGGFSRVFLVKNNRYPESEFVAKVMPEKIVKNSSHDASFLLDLQHANIVRIYKVFTEGKFLYVILEYCPGGPLNELLICYPSLTVDLLIYMFQQMLIGLAYCHSNYVAHRDIKPANILLDKNLRPKYTDFGISVKVKPGEKLKLLSCTKLFAAPEVLLENENDPIKADIWSLGVTFFVMASGRLPWLSKTPKNILKAIETGRYYIPDNVLPSMSDLFKSMMNVNPNKRPTAAELLTNSLFPQGFLMTMTYKLYREDGNPNENPMSEKNPDLNRTSSIHETDHSTNSDIEIINPVTINFVEASSSEYYSDDDYSSDAGSNKANKKDADSTDSELNEIDIDKIDLNDYDLGKIESNDGDSSDADSTQMESQKAKSNKGDSNQVKSGRNDSSQVNSGKGTPKPLKSSKSDFNQVKLNGCDLIQTNSGQCEINKIQSRISDSRSVDIDNIMSMKSNSGKEDKSRKKRLRLENIEHQDEPYLFRFLPEPISDHLPDTLPDPEPQFLDRKPGCRFLKKHQPFYPILHTLTSIDFIKMEQRKIEIGEQQWEEDEEEGEKDNDNPPQNNNIKNRENNANNNAENKSSSRNKAKSNENNELKK